MLRQASNWMMGAGAAAMFLGLCFLPAVLGDHRDPSLLAVGACVFSLGALIVAAGMYLKARALRAQPGSGATARAGSNSSRRQKAGCDACQADVPVIHCRVHHVHLCASCLAQHYDFRSCAYVPTTRRSMGRSSKGLAAKAHSA